MLSVSGLSRSYGDFKAVDDVSFNIGAGEIVGLLGHNGAGKTTIMKMLTGYLEPTSGSIQVDGLSMGEDTRAIQSRIGYLPENCPLWPEQRVIDYLEYQAVLHGVPADRTASGWGWPRPSSTTPTLSFWMNPPTAWIRPRSATCAS